jgi:pyrimidine 5'-nucleotidase
VDDVYKQLLDVDAALVWVNPIECGYNRSILDNMLRRVSDAAGVFVSAHPDIIRTMGTKEILYTTRQMAWGLEDTVIYHTMEQMSDNLAKSLAGGKARVLKRKRGQSGSGVWLVYRNTTELLQQAESSVNLSTMMVHVRHAERGAMEQSMQLDEFINYLHFTHGCLDGSDDGIMIDQAFQPRLSEGMIRAYMVHDKVGGFGHQVINALHPDTPLPDGHPRQYYPPDLQGNEPCDFQPLKHKLEDEWLPQLLELLGLTPDMLPVIWDADFMFGPKDADGKDTYVLCEINMSCVSPYPDAATPLIARATMQQVLLARSRSLAATSEERRPVLFLDCDDCLYQNNWKTADKITTSIGEYTKNKLGISTEDAYELYKVHGTCLKGLLAECLIDEVGAEAFLKEVHDIDYSDIHKDDDLRNVLAKVTCPMYIFTASASEHAQRCMNAIGIADLPFRGIIDTRTCKFETKHSRSSFHAAMATANVSDPSLCVFCDDNIKNVIAAKEMGWRTVLVGLHDRDTGALIKCNEADVHIASLHELQTAIPDVFQ